MGTKAVTLADIARQVGVSVNAVSLALRGKGGISQETRQRIISAAQAMNYTPLNPHRGNILALIPRRNAHSASDQSFFYKVCFHMEEYAASIGYHLVISSVSPEDEAAPNPPALLDTVPFAGIITVGNLSSEYCDMIQRLGKPYVMADQYYDSIAVKSVTTANTAGAFLLTKHLIDLGHTSIHYLGKVYTTSSLEDRWLGYRRAMQKHQLQFFENDFMYATNQSSDDAILRKTLCELKGRATAFVCGHDAIAGSVIDIMAEYGLACPGDFSVVGFDNIQSNKLLAYDLTTYDTPKQAIAQAAVDLLLRDEPVPLRSQIFGSIVYRQSAGRR